MTLEVYPVQVRVLGTRYPVLVPGSAVSLVPGTGTRGSSLLLFQPTGYQVPTFSQAFYSAAALPPCRSRSAKATASFARTSSATAFACSRYNISPSGGSAARTYPALTGSAVSHLVSHLSGLHTQQLNRFCYGCQFSLTFFYCREDNGIASQGSRAVPTIS